VTAMSSSRKLPNDPMAKPKQASEGNAPATSGDKPASSTRKRRSHSERGEVYVGGLVLATEGLEGDALSAEVDEWVEEAVEREVSAVPEALRPELRASMRAMLKADPALSALVAAMKR
jgi:hypothetical protein